MDMYIITRRQSEEHVYYQMISMEGQLMIEAREFGNVLAYAVSILQTLTVIVKPDQNEAVWTITGIPGHD